MSIGKAVILAAGRGSRMQRAADGIRLSDDQARVAAVGMKAMMPVGRPFIEFLLSRLAEAGIRRVCVVVAPGPNLLREHSQKLTSTRLEIECAIQEHPRGTAHALCSAKAFAGDDPFFMINSDNLYPATAFEALRCAKGSAVAGFTPGGLSTGNVPRDRLRHYAILVDDAYGHLLRVIEKPDHIVDLQRMPLINMNCWKFDPTIFDACRNVAQSPRGEYELPDAVNYAIENLGARFEVLPIDHPVLDLSSQADVSEVTERLKHVKVFI